MFVADDVPHCALMPKTAAEVRSMTGAVVGIPMMALNPGVPVPNDTPTTGVLTAATVAVEPLVRVVRLNVQPHRPPVVVWAALIGTATLVRTVLFALEPSVIVNRIVGCRFVLPHVPTRSTMITDPGWFIRYAGTVIPVAAPDVAHEPS